MTNESVTIHLGGLLRKVYRKYNEGYEVIVVRKFYCCGIKYKEKSDTRKAGIMDNIIRAMGANESA